MLDPFAGSGTTLVQALESGLDATGIDVAAFNCLLMRVKTARYNPFTLERELRDACARLSRFESAPVETSEYLQAWYAPQAAAELRFFGAPWTTTSTATCSAWCSPARPAPRGGRRTSTSISRTPQLTEYWCHKHRRACRPVETASRFLHRYALDTLARVREFARVCARGREADVRHGDAREIDYHEQHRYAYELLGLEDRCSAELGAAAGGTSRAALRAYADGIVATLGNVRRVLRPGAPVVIVVNDRLGLYPRILADAGFQPEHRYCRHVNRRTGRRAGEFFEDVLVARV